MGGGAACGRTASAQTSSSPAPMDPPGGLNRSPAARRALMLVPTASDGGGAGERPGGAVLAGVCGRMAATPVLRTQRGRSCWAVGARGAGRRAGAPRRVSASCPQPASPRPRSGHDHTVKLRRDSAADFSHCEDLFALRDLVPQPAVRAFL